MVKMASFMSISITKFFNFNFIGVYLSYNVVLVSSVHQSDSVIYIHVFILFKIIFSCRLSQTTE